MSPVLDLYLTWNIPVMYYYVLSVLFEVCARQITALVFLNYLKQDKPLWIKY